MINCHHASGMGPHIYLYLIILLSCVFDRSVSECWMTGMPTDWIDNPVTLPSDSHIARVGIADTYCHFRWSTFRSVGIKAVSGWTRECWHSTSSFLLARPAIPPTGHVWPHWPAFFLTGQNGRTGLATAWPLSRAFCDAHFQCFSYLRKWR